MMCYNIAMLIKLLQSAAVATVLVSAVSATAETAQLPETTYSDQAETQFTKFVPGKQTDSRRLDYGFWDDALEYFVFRMGRSIREGAPKVDPTTGTRRIYGHDSRYRLEGNRVIFSYFDQDIVDSLTAYREDLQNTAGKLDIGALSRNEQLAFWINLHNVAVIEQIAINYPLSQPSRMKLGQDRLPLDEAKIITIDGVSMSPRDIRTKIVFPNWRDPRVMYGFFRGEIGGPSIQPDAFNGQNLGTLLNSSAIDFVNSLRGTEKRGKTLHVSTIYEEGRPFFFAGWPSDIQQHLRAFSTNEVRDMVGKTETVRATIYEADLSDLSKGQVDPEYNPLSFTNDISVKGNGERTAYQAMTPPIGVPRAIGRLIKEQNEKFRKMARHRNRTGQVIMLDDAEHAILQKENEIIE